MHTYGISVGDNSFPGVFIVILNLVDEFVVVIYEKVRLNIKRYMKNCMLLHIFDFLPINGHIIYN